jgi:hypothetical protein
MATVILADDLTSRTNSERVSMVMVKKGTRWACPDTRDRVFSAS